MSRANELPAGVSTEMPSSSCPKWNAAGILRPLPQPQDDMLKGIRFRKMMFYSERSASSEAPASADKCAPASRIMPERNAQKMSVTAMLNGP